MRQTLVVLVAIALAACGRDTLVRAPADLQVAPSAVDFGDVYLEARAQRPMTVSNFGAAAETVEVAISGDAFALSARSYPLAAGETIAIPIFFAPTVAGPSAGSASLTWSGGAVTLALAGRGAPWPDCAAGPCQSAHFDPQLGACEVESARDGTSCVSSDPCLVNTVCANGQCLGQLRGCDDGDACTTDVCVSGQGCQHLQNDAQCKTDDPCAVGWCDPQLGCQTSAAEDGTPCGKQDGCKSAGFCAQGQCLQAAAPDGTPCQLDWAPCARDASCQAGTCDSPSADAMTPGQILWSFDAGVGTNIFNQVEARAVDTAGNSYAVDAQSNVLFSLDACGALRWRQALPNFPYDAMLWGDELIVQRGGLLAGHDSATGQTRWTTDLAQLFGYCDDGGACGDTIQGSMFVTPPVLTNLGQVMLTAQPMYQAEETLLASVGTDGTPQFVKTISAPSTRMGGASQVADQAGNLYGYNADLYGAASPTLWSFDPQGQLRFQVASYAQTHLSVGRGFVLDLGGQPGTAWDTSGSQAFTLPAPPVEAPWLNSTAVIDSHGDTTLWPGAYSTNAPGMLHVDAHGNALASVVIQGFPMSELALDEAGNTYVLGVLGQPEDFTLWRWDGKSAQPDLAVDLGPVFDGNDQRSNGQNVFLTHGMALVNVGNTLEAVFVGKHGASLDAPWPRGNGGTNENRRSPPLPLP